MRKSSVLFGYTIKNGKAVIEPEQAGRVRKLFDGYLSGLSYQSAAKEAGFSFTHSSAKMMMQDKHYLGDDFYPAIIERSIFLAAEEERKRRSRRLGRDDQKGKRMKDRIVPTRFLFGTAEKAHSDPYRQAEYIYSLIESEAE